MTVKLCSDCALKVRSWDADGNPRRFCNATEDGVSAFQARERCKGNWWQERKHSPLVAGLWHNRFIPT